MCANKSNTEENSGDKIWYGWIPKLSHEMIVKTGYGNRFFDEVTEEDLENVFENKDLLLSDKKIDRYLLKYLLKNKHSIEFSDHKITSCECCKEKVWSVNVKIKGKNDKVLIEGTAYIHKSGLVRYEILKNEVYSTNKAQDIHKIVRDCIHFHLHRSSDMPLPPVKVDKKCDEDLAKEKILRWFLDAFIEYKRKFGRVPLLEEEKDLSRALGEIVYAKSALDKFSERKYLFSWDDVVMGNTVEFIKFLKDDLKIEWAENAEIKKSNNNETITVLNKNNNTNLITINLNRQERKINLEISGEREHEYTLKEENGKLYIYKEENYEEFRKSFENFNESFKILLQRTTTLRDRILQHIVALLSSIIVMLSLIQFSSQWTAEFPQWIWIAKLSSLFGIVIVLYLIYTIYELRKPAK